jgi:hypothetical protein
MPEAVKAQVREGGVSATVAVREVRRDPDNARENIAQAIQKAKGEGKKRATSRHMASQSDDLATIKRMIGKLSASDYTDLNDWIATEDERRGLTVD